MKAFAQDRYGGPSVISLRELPEPEPGPREVLVDVEAVGLNPSDWNLRAGRARLFTKLPFPMVLGSDLSGRVIAVGSEVRSLRVGDAVLGAALPERVGTLCERVAIAEAQLARRPDTLCAVDAASLPIAFQTAWAALLEHLEVREGERVLITGGSGGVGTLAIQIARSLGAEVVVTAGARSADFVRELGAHEVLDYRDPDRFVAVGKVAAILDGIGGAERLAALRALVPGGRLVSITGIPTGDAVRPFGAGWGLRGLFDLLSVRERLGARRRGARYSSFFLRASGERMARGVALFEAGVLRPVIDEVFPFARALEALARVESGRARVKVVVALATQGAAAQPR